MSSSALSWGVEEFVVLVGLGDFHVGVELSSREVTEVDSLELLAKIGNSSAVDFLGGWASLLVDPRDDGVLGAATGVVLALSISENWLIRLLY